MKHVLLTIALTAIGCGSGEIGGEEPASRVSRELEPLSLHSIDWNAAKEDLGAVSAIAEDDEELVLFGSKGATLMAGGAVQGVIGGATKWSYAGVIPAADGVGDWMVGVADDGHVYRVRGQTTLEDVSARYGLTKDRVRSVVGIDGKSVAFGFEGGLAIADGSLVTRYEGPKNGVLTGGGGRLAWISDGAVKVLTLSDRKVRAFALESASGVAIDASGRVVVVSDNTLWVEQDGTLTLRWTADAHFGAIATAGPRVWMTVGAELAVATGDALARSNGAAIESGAHLSGTAAGDVWIVGPESVRKFSGTAPSEAIADWEGTIKPIYAKVCASCHAPGGAAGSDLSTFEAWTGRRDAIEKRVLVDQTMPPKGSPFTDNDRATIRDWLSRTKR